MGDAVDDILCLLSLSDGEKKVYETVKSKFEEQFVKHSIIFECTEFNCRQQKEGEMLVLSLPIYIVWLNIASMGCRNQLGKVFQ